MTLKQKILLLGAVPVLLMALIVNVSNYIISKNNLEAELVESREDALKDRKALLSSYLMLAKSAIEKVYSQPDTPENREQVKDILRPLRYSSDGYFFVFDTNGVQVMHGASPAQEGKNRWQDKDAKGKLLIQNIVNAARQGDGYSEYWTLKPSIVGTLPSSRSMS